MRWDGTDLGPELGYNVYSCIELGKEEGSISHDSVDGSDDGADDGASDGATDGCAEWWR